MTSLPAESINATASTLNLALQVHGRPTQDTPPLASPSVTVPTKLGKLHLLVTVDFSGPTGAVGRGDPAGWSANRVHLGQMDAAQVHAAVVVARPVSASGGPDQRNRRVSATGG